MRERKDSVEDSCEPCNSTQRSKYDLDIVMFSLMTNGAAAYLDH